MGRALATTTLRGYPNSRALFLVLAWMMVIAPVGQIRALLRRWEAAHVPIAVKPGGYDTVVKDLAGALGRAGIQVTRQRAHWAYELPGKVLAVLGGETVRALVPVQLMKAARGEGDLHAIGTELNERNIDFEEWEIPYRLLLQVRLRVSATGTDAIESADEPRPALRERVAAAARLLAGRSNGH